jgi:hypothetical protein
VRGLALYRAELNERLVVHWTGGAWRVPLGQRHAEVRAADGSRLGRIVCADAADVARAIAGLVPAPPPDPGALARALDPVAGLLAEVRALEGVAGDAWAPCGFAPEGQGPAVLLTAADRPVAEIVAALAALAPRGAVWKPAPGAAASAHLILRALAPVLGRSVALVQGDHASGAALAAGLAPVWAGQGPAPLSLAGAAPARR